MKRIIPLMAILAIVVVAVSPTVFAAKPAGSSGASKPVAQVEMKGYDVSYPQCGRKLPTDYYFGIIGVNGGTANSENPCLADQLVWASKARDGSVQSKHQVYVNTANPGEVIEDITTWPRSPFDLTDTLPENPYGDRCIGENDLACSWLYGWNRSIYTERAFQAAAASRGLTADTAAYVWWLDVETMNTWQNGSSAALQRNTAALEGFAAYYQAKQATVGLYSTAYQWGVITGNHAGAESNLAGLANWRPSGASLANAKANCGIAPLTPGGYISLTQYVVKNLDHNYSCL